MLQDSVSHGGAREALVSQLHKSGWPGSRVQEV